MFLRTLANVALLLVVLPLANSWQALIVAACFFAPRVKPRWMRYQLAFLLAPLSLFFWPNNGFSFVAILSLLIIFERYGERLAVTHFYLGAALAFIGQWAITMAIPSLAQFVSFSAALLLYSLKGRSDKAQGTYLIGLAVVVALLTFVLPPVIEAVFAGMSNVLFYGFYAVGLVIEGALYLTSGFVSERAAQSKVKVNVSEQATPMQQLSGTTGLSASEITTILNVASVVFVALLVVLLFVWRYRSGQRAVHSVVNVYVDEELEQLVAEERVQQLPAHPLRQKVYRAELAKKQRRLRGETVRQWFARLQRSGITPPDVPIEQYEEIRYNPNAKES